MSQKKNGAVPAPHLLTSSPYWTVNKTIAKYLRSNEAALVLADLIAKRDYFKSKGELQEDGSFFNISNRLEDDLNISERKRRRYTDLLVQKGLVLVQKRGIPNKNFYYIQDAKIAEVLSQAQSLQNVGTSDDETQSPDTTKRSHKSSRNRDSNKNKEKKNKKEEERVKASSSSSLVFSSFENQRENNSTGPGDDAGNAVTNAVSASQIASSPHSLLDEEMYQQIEGYGLTKQQVIDLYGYPPDESKTLEASEALLSVMYAWPTHLDGCATKTDQYIENVCREFAGFWENLLHESITINGKTFWQYRTPMSPDLAIKTVDHLIKKRFTDESGSWSAHGPIKIQLRAKLIAVVEELEAWFLYDVYLSSPLFKKRWDEIDKVELAKLKDKPVRAWMDHERKFHDDVADRVCHGMPLMLLKNNVQLADAQTANL